jgi:hypothetical protein
MRLKPKTSQSFLHALLTLYGIPGVVGVGWGQRRRGRRWTDELCLCAHVKKKRPMSRVPRDERFPARLNGFPIDVLEVGELRLYASNDRMLDHTDEVEAPGTDGPRTGTISALAYTPSGTLALLAGHVALPLRGGRIVRDFKGGPAAPISFADPVLSHIPGKVLKGEFENGRALDWALASLPKIDPDELLTKHYAAGQETPLAIRRTTLVAKRPVFHYSRLSSRRRILRGFIRQVAPVGVEFTAPDETPATYSGLTMVTSQPGYPFSLEGDSGSLVVDENDEVIGTIVGGKGDGTTTYVAPIKELMSAVGSVGRYFFK